MKSLRRLLIRCPHRPPSFNFQRQFCSQLEDVKKKMNEQSDILFPRTAEVQGAQEHSTVPYKVYDRHSTAETDDESADEEEVTIGQELDEADERGFKYRGMEPTKFGDWQHKGRV